MDHDLNPIEALNLLGTLEGVTRKSLPKPAPGTPSQSAVSNQTTAAQPSASPSPTQAKQSLPALPTIASPPSFTTSSEDYKPALKDTSVIEALLEYHQSVSGEKIEKTPSRPKSKTAPVPKFIPESLQEVSVKPKPSRFNRTPGIYRTILRSDT